MRPHTPADAETVVSVEAIRKRYPARAGREPVRAVDSVTFAARRGEILGGGGRVVKNAAGFDLPKLMVGSLGRFGVLTELTFKVFPAPEAALTIRAERRAMNRGLLGQC